MSVVGADLGAANTVIAVARNRGVDVITNEVSNRSTPTLVGFGPKSRYLGETAKTQEISNLKNTVSSLIRLAGRSLNDPDVQIEQTYVSAPLVDVNGQVGAEVTYMGKKDKFSATQLMAMFLTKLRQTASNELRLPVNDVVLSCPPWFTDAQRRSILDAADIAGLKCLRLINDTTAAALGYGITKTDLPTAEEKPRRVCFVDIGHSTYSVSVVEFKKGELTVKSTASDRHFGGRNFDKALVDHFAKEFKEKFKIDIHANAKARFRVLAACEKLKKILSANASAPLNIESVMDDIDVRSFLKREELEELVKDLLTRTTGPLEQALAEAKLKPEDIDSVEMVGGCTRVPAIKTTVQQFFNKTLSFTLNQDEAIARGCAFSCAILSPVFRVRDFHIYDQVPYPIEFTWEKSPDIPDEDTSLTVFNRGNTMPSTKILTFYRKQPFDLEARYAKPDLLPGKTNPWIGRFSVKGVKADDKDEFMICKLKARVSQHGVLNIEQGYYVEDQEIEEPIPEEKKDDNVGSNFHHSQKEVSESVEEINVSIRSNETHDSGPHPRVIKKARTSYQTNDLTDEQAMDVDKKDEADGEAASKPKTRKVKKQVRKGELPLSTGTAALDQASKDSLSEREGAMIMEDKLVADTEDKKNELESYIYEMRGKIDDQYSEYASEDEKTKLKDRLEKSEDWLYEDGEDATKAQYIAKMDEIRALAGPIVQRHLDKLDAERQAREAVEAEKRAAEEAKRKEQEEAKKAAEDAKKAEQGDDTKMDDAEGEKPTEVEEK